MSMSRRLLVAAFLLAAAAGFAQTPRQMRVTVKETQVRAAPTYMGKILATLPYDAPVSVLTEQSGWARVKLPSGEGWVHLSALTMKKVSLQSGSQTVGTGASSGEVALAGKGFNQQVEERYKEEKDLDYTWVDRMAGYTVTPEQALAFLQAGGLDTSLGGAP